MALKEQKTNYVQVRKLIAFSHFEGFFSFLVFSVQMNVQWNQCESLSFRLRLRCFLQIRGGPLINSFQWKEEVEGFNFFAGCHDILFLVNSFPENDDTHICTCTHTH